LPRRGFDHWFRLFLPGDGDDGALELAPDRFTTGTYLKFVASGGAKRLTVRNYTVRHHRPESGEVDVDFVVHSGGVAGPWAAAARPGARVALLDQGRGFDLLPDADFFLLAGDESAQPAVMGILRDLPGDARGLAVIEVAEPADADEGPAPSGVEVRRLFRDAGDSAGSLALAEVRAFQPARPETLSAYIAGEHTLAQEGRRHLVAGAVPKQRAVFMGYWRAA
jgi:NADPH-dependent ferric siderophore reductase